MQFILQKSEKPSQNANKLENKSGEQENSEKSADGRKSFDKQFENIGIVKGVPHKSPATSPENNPGKAEPVKDRKPSSENLLDLYNPRLNNSNYSNSSSSPVTSPTCVSGNLGLKPPAYRNPPAPKQSIQNQKLIDLNNGNFSPIFPSNDVLVQNVQYRDLIQLIKYQREKINVQQNDLTKVS